MKNRKIPSYFFFLNQMLYLKVKGIHMLHNWLFNVQSELYTQWLISFKTAVSSVDTVSTSTVMNSRTYLKLALEEYVKCLRNEIFQWITSVLSKVQKSDGKVQTNKPVLPLAASAHWECRSLLHIILPSHPCQVSEVIWLINGTKNFPFFARPFFCQL